MQNRIAIIASSMYAGVAAVYMLASNYNGVGVLKEILKNNGANFNVTITHKENYTDTIHVTTNSNYTWFVLLL